MARKKEVCKKAFISLHGVTFKRVCRLRKLKSGIKALVI